jgi:hypothetical protein
MLRGLKDLESYAIHATDGNIGQVKDFYFDDEAWVIRYLVVGTGTWLAGRKVLISPIAIGHPNWTERILPVSITKEQVKESPDIDTEKPVSRQHELRYVAYYGYQNYWGGAGLWGAVPYPSMMDQAEDLHLRSCKAIIGHHIQATDGEIGHVQGLLVDDETWAIRYLVADTANWWLGHRVLIAPQWIQEVSWSNTAVSVDLTRQAVKGAPPYDSAAQLEREQEVGIYKHYGLPGYWAGEMKREGPTSRA